MPKPGRSDIVVAVLVVGAIALGALGFAGFTDDTANSLLFAAWTLALLALFMLALRLPLRGSGSRLSAWLTTALVAAAAIAIVVAANVALFRHDVHFDVSREGRNTPPAQFMTVVSNLHAPLSLTYFYNAGDPNALAAKELITIAAHGHPLFAFRAIDLDKEPGLARDVGVRAYNTAVLQASGRKVLVENTTDPTRIAFAAMRALKERIETLCFITGHGEPFGPAQAHFHYSHVETLRSHDKPGAGDVLEAAPEQLDRLQIALTEIGYELRGIVTASESAIPPECTVVADIGPRTAFAAGETDLMVKYLAGGGRLLLLLDPVFPVSADLQKHLLGAVGLRHTEGSMNIIVKTADGDANICGDVIYDFNGQIVEPFHEIGDMEPRVTGNHGTTKRQEKAAIKKVLARSRFALPIHDWPAMIEGGQVIARLRDSVPGPIVQSLPRRNWFPA